MAMRIFYTLGITWDITYAFSGKYCHGCFWKTNCGTPDPANYWPMLGITYVPPLGTLCPWIHFRRWMRWGNTNYLRPRALVPCMSLKRYAFWYDSIHEKRMRPRRNRSKCHQQHLQTVNKVGLRSTSGLYFECEGTHFGEEDNDYETSYVHKKVLGPWNVGKLEWGWLNNWFKGTRWSHFDEGNKH